MALIDINEKWALILASTASYSYLSFLDVKGPPWDFWHYLPRLGLWFRWDVLLQDWVLDVPPAFAQLLTCVEKPV